MPKHSGARFYRELQKDKTLSGIPVLVVTGHARDELGKTDFDELTMCGPGVYLEKPVRPDSYVSAVRRLLGMESSDLAEPEDLRGELDRAYPARIMTPCSGPSKHYERNSGGVMNEQKTILIVEANPTRWHT